MPALTIKNIPEHLYEQLKTAATIHHRSLNSEVIFCLEKTLLPVKISTEQRLAQARALRKKVRAEIISAAEIDVVINEGRA